MRIKLLLWIVLTLYLTPINMFCQENASFTETSWDSVAAEIQVIESLTQPDSIKLSLTKELFTKWHITEKDYRLFYDDFLAKPLEHQREFIEKVKEILQSSVKKKNTSLQNQNK